MCPVGFCTAYVGEGNYLACCPRGYQFASTGEAVIKSRPAYGGVCYTDIARGQELTAVIYDALGATREELWKPSTTGAQGWAHPIDGWAVSRPSVGCAVTTTTSSASSGASASFGATTRPLSSATANAKKKARASGGVIAGAVLGALVGLAVILGLVLVLLRRKKQNRAVEEKRSESDDGTLHQQDGAQIYQKDGDDGRVEVNGVSAPVEVGPMTTLAELDSRGRADAHELGPSERVSELPAGDDRRLGQR